MYGGGLVEAGWPAESSAAPAVGRGEVWAADVDGGGGGWVGGGGVGAEDAMGRARGVGTQEYLKLYY